MKRSDIKDGQTYQNDDGSAARRVICITDEPSDLPPHSFQRKLRGPWVIYEQVRGRETGSGSALNLRSFALWARSIDGGTTHADLPAPDNEQEAEVDYEPLRREAVEVLSRLESIIETLRSGESHNLSRWAARVGLQVRLRTLANSVFKK